MNLEDRYIKEHITKPMIENTEQQESNNKNNVLFLLHNDFINGDNHGVGGTEYHTKDIIDGIKSVNFFVMYTTGEYIKVQLFGNMEVKTYKYKLDQPIGYCTFSRDDYKKQLEKILEDFNIDVIHVQHFIRNTFDIIEIATLRNIPIYLTLHDYYLICPKINLLDKNNNYCKYTRSKRMCVSCIKNLLNNNNIDLLCEWNEKIYKYLKRFDRVFAPSHSVVEIFNEYYKNLYGDFNVDIEVIEHGVCENNAKKEGINNFGKKFRVAFIGSLDTRKGIELILDIIKLNINNKNFYHKYGGVPNSTQTYREKNDQIEWHVFGNVGDTRLNRLVGKSIKKHGPYQRDNIVNELVNHDIDLVCILSIWPETYSYTFSEAIMANIPILTTNIGALGERMSRYECGWTVPYNTKPKDILDFILKISTDKEEYIKKYYKIRELKLESKETVCKKYEEFYTNYKSINK